MELQEERGDVINLAKEKKSMDVTVYRNILYKHKRNELCHFWFSIIYP